MSIPIATNVLQFRAEHWDPLDAYMYDAVQRMVEAMQRELALDIEFGFDSRHHPDGSDYWTVQRRLRREQRGERAVADTPGRPGRLAYRKERR